MGPKKHLGPGQQSHTSFYTALHLIHFLHTAALTPLRRTLNEWIASEPLR